MNSPLISIIVPIYKVEKYLRKCVESILAQTYANIEVILVDDGSPDGCPAICDEYAAKDSRVVVIHQPNAGVSSARNAGLDAAKGEYIGFIDGDDWIEPDMVEIQYEVITRSGADIAISTYCQNDEKPKKISVDEYVVFSAKEAISRIFYGYGEILFSCGRLFAEKIVDNVRFSPMLTSTQDALFSIQTVVKSKKIAFINYQSYHYVFRENSTSHAFRSSSWTALNAVDMVVDVIKNFDITFAATADKGAIEHDIYLATAAEAKGKFSKDAYKKVAVNIRKHISKGSWNLLSFKDKCLVCLLLLGRGLFIAARKIWRAISWIRL